MADDDLKTNFDKFQRNWNEFKEANDDRLKSLEKNKGVAELESKLEKIEKSFDTIETQAQAKAREEKAEAVFTELKASILAMETALARGAIGGNAKKAELAAYEEEYTKNFDRFLRKGREELELEQKKMLETKIVQAGIDNLGGYYLAPSQMEADIIKAVIEMSPFRTLARVTAIGVKSLLLPKRTGTFAAVRTTELGTRAETEGYRTGMVEITAPEMYADVRISQQMIEDAYFNMESEMQQEISEQFAVKEGAEFINGGGAAVLEAEGVMTNADITSVVSGTAANLKDADGGADGFISAYYGIKTAYSKNASWILNRSSIGAARKLKDGQKQYIWQPALTSGAPNTILGATYTEMPDMPSEGANLYPVAFGDWQRAYRIVDRIGISVLRDVYTVASTGQIKYLARKRVGGAVTLAEAIIKIKCST